MKKMDFAFKQLEEEFAEFDGSKYASGVNTGTSALHLALLAVGVGKGDEVIVPDFTMGACPFAVSYTGATPVFVDCNGSLNIDVNKIEEKITDKTKAIMAVHIYGRVCDMITINRIARKYNLKVIEDASEAHGAVYGSPADITCYSLYKNKIICAEEGGIITSNNRKYIDDINDLKCMAFGKKHNFYHERVGFNYRLSDCQAKLALKSLRSWNENIEKRFYIEEWFEEFLPEEWQLLYRDAVWVYDFIPKDKKKVSDILRRNNISFREFFKPCSSFPMYAQKSGKNALKYSEKGLYFNINTKLTKNNVKKICNFLT